MPPDITNLILPQYTGFFLNVTAPKSGLRTGPIHAQRGVLQGDTLSPLLFNIVFDSLMSTFSDPHIQSHGVLWGDGFTRYLWTQLADDAAVVCDNLQDTQLILTFFQRWIAWAGLTIRPDKSFAYAAAQVSGHYQQIQPSLTISRFGIPSEPHGGYMTCLGRRFSFSSDLDIARALLVTSKAESLAFVDSLHVSPIQKCHALNLHLRAHLSFPLSHYSFQKPGLRPTWITWWLERWEDGWTYLPVPHRTSCRCHSNGLFLTLFFPLCCPKLASYARRWHFVTPKTPGYGCSKRWVGLKSLFVSFWRRPPKNPLRKPPSRLNLVDTWRN